MHTLASTLASLRLAAPALTASAPATWFLTYALNALWQIPLLFAAAWLVAGTTRRASPAFHHALWTTTLFAEIFLPAISVNPTQLVQRAQAWLASLGHPAPELHPQITITMGTPHLAAPGFHLPPTLLAFAAILYFAAFAFFAIRLAIGLHKTASLRCRAQPVTLTGHVRQSYDRCVKLFAIPNPHVAVSAEIASPVTLGIRHPSLLLPHHFDTLLDEDLDAALAHEFAHLHRRDFAKNLAYELLSLPIAFHPVVWLTRARMNETREQLCDAMAASAVAGPQRYARSLLRLATQFAAHPNAAPTPHAIGIFDAHPFKNFERRVMNLTQHPIQLRGAARLLPTTLAVVLIGSACTSALAFRQQIAAPEPQTNTDTTQTAALQPLVLAIPRSGQPARSYNLEIPDTPNNTSALPSGSYVLKVFPPKASSPKQANDEPTARIAAGVIAGQRTNFVEPVYPPEAKKAKLNGTVVLHAIIDKDGTIKTLNVLSSTNPLFNDSALEAVHKWTYKPYLLNGEPTAVDTNITVNYALNPSPEPEPSPAPSPYASNRQPSAPSTQLMHVGGDVKPPIVIHRVDPEYSPEAHDAKFSGDVIVYLQVDTDGHTSHIRVKKGVGMGLDEKAVKAVSQYRFKPATLAGKPVPVDLYIDVNFQML